MEMTRGMKWASEDCYKALRALVDAANANNNRAFLFRNCEEHAAIIEEAERALSYYDWHGYNGIDNNRKGEEAAARAGMSITKGRRLRAIRHSTRRRIP